MNICMLADKPLPSERPTGIGVAAFNIALALSRRGNTIHYVCRGKAETTANINEHLTVQTIRHFSKDNLAASLSILKKEGCNLVHVHSSAAAPSLVAAWALGRPTLFHSHSDQPLHPLGLTLIRNVEMSLSQRVITVSQSTREEIVRNHRLSPGKVVVAYNGVDTDEFKPFPPPASVLRKYGLEGYNKIVLSIGTVEKKKGQARMVECLPELLRAWPDLVYVNAGAATEPFQSRLLGRAERLGVSKAVRLLPPLPREELVALINAAEICVHLSTREAFGLAVVEEMACAKTVIAFNLDAMPEIIEDRVDGLLVNPGSMEDLTKSMLGALGDPELAGSIGQAARLKVSSKFTWERTASRLEEIYRGLVG